MTAAYMRDDEDGCRRDAGGQDRAHWAGDHNGVLLGGTATAASMAPSLSPTEERPNKNRPTQHIRYGIKTTKTAS